MRRQPKARTTKSKSRIDDFFQIKESAHKRRKDHKVQLEINMHRLGSKIVELHHLKKRSGTYLSGTCFSGQEMVVFSRPSSESGISIEIRVESRMIT